MISYNLTFYHLLPYVLNYQASCYNFKMLKNFSLKKFLCSVNRV